MMSPQQANGATSDWKVIDNFIHTFLGRIDDDAPQSDSNNNAVFMGIGKVMFIQ